MPRFRFYLFSLAFALSLAAAALPAFGVPMLDTKDLRPGMKGFGKSVFKGFEITTFEVTVMDVIHHWSPKGDLVLVECHGGPNGIVDLSGIQAGMSGSPVFIEETPGAEPKLIGALAYAWNGSKLPIAGVTPIKEMLTVWEREGQQNASDDQMAQAGRLRHQAAGITGGDVHATNSKMHPHPDPLPGGEGTIMGGTQEQGSLIARNFDEWVSALPGQEAPKSGLTPVLTPLMVGGLSQQTLDWLRPLFDKAGLIPIAGSGGGGTEADYSYYEGSRELQPGSAIGAILVIGDIRAAGIGTVTYREGDRLLAFGHPMFHSGDFVCPVSEAVIHGILPSQNLSFKFGSPTKVVGALRQDRVEAISANLKDTAPFVPLTITYPRLTSKMDGTMHVEVLKDKRWTPIGLFIAISESIEAAIAASSDMTLRTEVTVTFEDRPPLVIREVLSGSLGGQDVAYTVFRPVGTLLQNFFEEAKISSVDLNLTYERDRTALGLIDARPHQLVVAPGEKLAVDLTMMEYHGKKVLRTVELVIPRTLSEGKVIINFMDGSIFQDWEMKRASTLYQSRSLDGIIRQMTRSPRSNEICATIYFPDSSLTMGQKELGDLPPSFAWPLQETPDLDSIGFTKFSLAYERRLAFEAPVQGFATAQVEIRTPNKE